MVDRRDDLRDVDLYDDNDQYVQRRDDAGFNWLPLLLIPLAFIFGWGARDVIDQGGIDTNPEFGVGGGPDTVVVSPTPVNDTGTILNPNDIDEDAMDIEVTPESTITPEPTITP